MMFGGFQSLFNAMDPYASFHSGSQFMIGDRTHKRRRRGAVYGQLSRT